MKLNFWQILGTVLIVAAILYSVYRRAETTPQPSTVPPAMTPEVTTLPT
jgi:hypothetical protein